MQKEENDKKNKSSEENKENDTKNKPIVNANTKHDIYKLAELYDVNKAIVNEALNKDKVKSKLTIKQFEKKFNIRKESG